MKARGRNMAELLWIIGIAIPQTRDYRVHAQLVKRGQQYAFTRMAGTFGESDLSGKFTIENKSPRPHVEATLATKSLAIADAAPFIGYNPDIVAAKGAEAAAGSAPRNGLPLPVPLPLPSPLPLPLPLPLPPPASILFVPPSLPPSSVAGAVRPPMSAIFARIAGASLPIK